LLQSATLDRETLPPGWISVGDHPAFPSAARRLAENLLAVCEADRKLAAICKDAGHYMTAMSAAYLESQGTLTLSSLRQICAGSGMLTANRAAALIDFMAHLGFLEFDAGSDCRTTPAFRRAWSRLLHVALDAAALVDPSLVAVRDMVTDATVYHRFLAVQAGRLHDLARLTDPFPALRAAFLHPLAGCSILHTLVLACTDADFRPNDGAIVSLAGLARRFGVSQPHVRRLLKRAEASRFLLHLGPSLRAFDPVGFPTLRFHYAMQIHELIECAHALQAMQAAEPPWRASAPRRTEVVATAL
jgi:hypothetical protein